VTLLFLFLILITHDKENHFLTLVTQWLDYRLDPQVCSVACLLHLPVWLEAYHLHLKACEDFPQCPQECITTTTTTTIITVSSLVVFHLRPTWVGGATPSRLSN
jgi:hypothetical protein